MKGKNKINAINTHPQNKTKQHLDSLTSNCHNMWLNYIDKHLAPLTLSISRR